MSKLLITIMLVLASISVVHARGGGGGFSFDELQFWLSDQDRNLHLDRDEARSKYAHGLSEVFEQVDENGDGKVYQLEFYEFLNGRSSVKPSNTIKPEVLKPSKG